MNRLRIILYAAALLAGVSACDKEVLPDTGASLSPGERILFSAPPELTVETLTRAAQDGFTEGNAFGVMAYCVPYTVGSDTEFNYGSGSADWSTKRSNCAPEVLYNQKVTVAANGCTYDHTNSSGDSNNPAYWYRDGYGTDGKENTGVTGAANYRYTFFAWYPYEYTDGSGRKYFEFSKPTGQTDKGAPIVTYTMPQTGGDISTSLDKKATPDAMLAVLYNRTKADGSLTFDFSHVLTGLGFEVNNFSDYNLEIHKVWLTGSFYKSVTVDFSKATSADDFFTFGTDRYTGTYTIFDADDHGGKGITLNKPGDGESVTKSPSPIGDGEGGTGGSHLLLISGTGTSFGEDVYIHLDYTFNGTRVEDWKMQRPGTFTPQPGVKYTAQLNFVGNAFVLQFVVDNNESWEDGGTDNATDDDGNFTGGGDVTFE